MRHLREEAGMTMGLTIMLVILVGVLGAGLLAFVQSDLEMVMKANGGQKALSAAETGIQAAKRELLSAPSPESYDGASGIGDSVPESGWSYASPAGNCGDLPSGPGRCIAVGTDRVRVAVRYLPPPTAVSGAGSRYDPIRAPENPPDGADDYADGRDYFRVEADGLSGGYRRRVQAILVLAEEPVPEGDVSGEAGGHRVRVWSWRECYDEECL